MKSKSWSVERLRAAACALGLALCALGGRAEERPPNLILILADDLGYSDLSCYGGWIDTPHIDALAADGLRFTDFHSNGAVCSPTRAALMTGRYQQRAGIDGVVYAADNRPAHYHGLQDSEITLPETLKQAGYATGMFGKWHLGYFKKYNPIHHGFDRFQGYVSGNIDFFSHIDQSGYYDWWRQDHPVEEPGYTTELITKHGLEFIEEQRDQPFFLYLAHEAPHYPYQGPNDSPERVLRKPGQNLGAREDRKQAYREMVESMDQGVGRIRAKIEELGLANNTLIFFMSDNGATRLGSNIPFRGHKGSVWEGGHRVPAIAWWPETIPSGTTCSQLAIGMDIAPTLATLSGTGFDRPLDGADLSAYFRDPTTSTKSRTLVWEHGNQQAVRAGDWKLVQREDESPQLFNLNEDSAEANDLSKQRPDMATQLSAELEIWRKDVAATATPQPEGDATRRVPRVLIIGDSISLGYTPFVQEALQGKAKVVHNPGNAQHTGTGLERLEDWLGDEPWDVIHFNWGLWDLCYRHPDATTPGNRDKVEGTLTYTPDAYADNLQKLVQRLRWTRADLIWASTTPVPDREPGRYPGSAQIYNARARDIMESVDIPINDLHGHISPDFDALAIRPGDVHFSREGSRALATQVAREIEAALKRRNMWLPSTTNSNERE